MIDLSRQELDAGMGYGLEPELTSWPTPCPQEGGWIDLPARTRGERTEVADVTEEVTEQVPRPDVAPPEPRWLRAEDCWFFGAYRRYHAGLERLEEGPEGWRPGRIAQQPAAVGGG